MHRCCLVKLPYFKLFTVCRRIFGKGKPNSVKKATKLQLEGDDDIFWKFKKNFDEVDK